jgi:hypothetical protein
MKRMLLIALLGSSSFLFAQTVCVGTTQQCIEAQRKLCASEPAPVNLELSEDRLVSGTVADETGANFSDVEVQLRMPRTGAVLQSAAAKNGEFDFGKVKAGSYRLVVVKPTPSGPERLKEFDQAKLLACNGSTTKCELKVVLTVHGSDNPIDFCPPK